MIRALFVIFLYVCSFNVQATTYPYAATANVTHGWVLGGLWYSSQGGACSAFGGSDYHVDTSGVIWAIACTNNTYSQVTYPIYASDSCAGEGVAPDTSMCTLSCPQGGTLSGTNCIAPVTCPAAASSAMVGGAKAWKITGSSAACVSGFSYGGCGVTCTSGASSGGIAACTGCFFTGAPGDPQGLGGSPVGDTPATQSQTPESCLASGKGYVVSSSGVTTCVVGEDSPGTQPLQTTEKTKESTTNGGGTSGTTGTKITECSGGNCKETTTTDDGAGGVSTEVQEKPATTFCSDNPNSPMCKDAKDPCEDNPDRVGCLDSGEPDDGADLPDEQRGVSSITQQSFASAASCPGDISLPHGTSLSFSWSCQMASALRPLLLALAWLFAGYIVMGAFRNG